MFNFKISMQKQGLTERTRKEYQRRVNRWLEFLSSRRVTWRQATRRDVKAYQDYLLKSDHQPWTVNSFVIAIRSFYRLAFRSGVVEANPAQKLRGLRVDDRTAVRLSNSTVRKLRSWLRTQPLNWQAGFAAMSGAGLKVDEVARLTVDDVSLRHGQLYLRVRHSRFARDREVPVLDRAAALTIYRYWKRQPDTLLGPLFKARAETFQWTAKLFAARCHIRFDCHALRRDFAVRVCNGGGTIPQLRTLLGHGSNLQTFYYSLARDDDGEIKPDFFIDDDDDQDPAAGAGQKK